jgi:hypothetical protein
VADGIADGKRLALFSGVAPVPALLTSALATVAVLLLELFPAHKACCMSCQVAAAAADTASGVGCCS